MKSKLFLLMVAAGMIGRVEGAASWGNRIASGIHYGNAALCALGSLVMSAVIYKKEHKEVDRFLIEAKEYYDRREQDISEELMHLEQLSNKEEALRRTEELRNKILSRKIIRSFFKQYADVDHVFIGTMPEFDDVINGRVCSKNGKVYCEINETAERGLTSKDATFRAMAEAMLVHECGHVINKDIERDIAFKALWPFFVGITAIRTSHFFYKICKNKKMGAFSSLVASIGTVALINETEYPAFMMYSQSRELAADRYVCKTKNKQLIKARCCYFEQQLPRELLVERTQQEFLSCLTFIERMVVAQQAFFNMSSHPTIKERLAVCYKALAQLEAETVEKEKELNKVD